MFTTHDPVYFGSLYHAFCVTLYVTHQLHIAIFYAWEEAIQHTLMWDEHSGCDHTSYISWFSKHEEKHYTRYSWVKKTSISTLSVGYKSLQNTFRLLEKNVATTTNLVSNFSWLNMWFSHQWGGVQILMTIWSKNKKIVQHTQLQTSCQDLLMITHKNRPTLSPK